MSKLGPKCQYFVWPPLFSSNALTLLGMEFTRASQVATRVLFHSSMTTSRSWWMLETLRSSTFHLRMPHRCSIGFRTGDMLGQSITFTLSFFSKAVVILEVCLGSLSCWEGIMLCFSMSQYMLAFMVPPMNCSSPVPAALMQPQTMTPPPPCLTVGKTHLSLYFVHADQFDAVCGVWSERWQADSPPLQHLQQCWQHSYVYFPNTTSGYDVEHVHNFFGRPWRGLFWVEPVLLNRCMVLATVLQLSFRVLAIFL